MLTPLRWSAWATPIIAFALGMCCVAEAATPQSPPSSSQSDSVYFGALINGKLVDLSRAETEDGVLVDRGCNQNPSACHAAVLPSVLAPTGNCQGPAAFVSTDVISYYVTNTVGGAPKPNCNITIQIDPVINNNGGHCHGAADRPVGTPVAGTYSGNTGADGLQFKVTHVWPQVSGRILVQAVNVANMPCSPLSTLNNNLFICVRGPQPATFSAGLLQLPEGPGYELDGGPDNVTRHPDHHYGTPNTIGALQALAAEWMNEAPGRPILGYNDISLRWGGVFDIMDGARSSDWTPPHCGHRNGRTFDFRLVPVQHRLAMRRVLRKYFNIGVEHSDHWHMNLRPGIPD